MLESPVDELEAVRYILELALSGSIATPAAWPRPSVEAFHRRLVAALERRATPDSIAALEFYADDANYQPSIELGWERPVVIDRGARARRALRAGVPDAH
jgi:hypothetical protein